MHTRRYSAHAVSRNELRAGIGRAKGRRMTRAADNSDGIVRHGASTDHGNDRVTTLSQL